MHGQSPRNWTWKELKVNYVGKAYGTRKKQTYRGYLGDLYEYHRPLHGLPVLIKGNIGTRDRMQTNGVSWHIT